jgi:hypothetical protein
MLPLVKTEIDSNAWADGGQVSRTQGAAPIQIHLKPGAAYPHQRQYHHQETRESLSKIIRRLKQQNLLVPYNSPCSITDKQTNKQAGTARTENS